ncbi:uncharacterized protein PHACADRAFT_259897 [Phanerochaete carnosa HHB-10118-sp]|uniref:RNA exonuclease 4 n=1 Tax=Phanerochaete carnosa (strain HHB-10118-sp) TaxID=650164 RepID=K5UU19_PHACS|nr:uncharacterized protein PHACADRAFT_259897 [Phanerochaete carnosa HHB-10118-sp]EKM53481.1 hypothetical protein PHACADRAFT_259897 [Phanerochaete carnosa HHB-10118-sp]
MSTTSSVSEVLAKALETDAHFPRGIEPPVASTSAVKIGLKDTGESKNGESVDALRKLILGELAAVPRKIGAKVYVAIDCEMVGLGIKGSESSLARVSIIDFNGVVELDEIVQQKERVVDYRTKWSGIRPEDMTRAKPFREVQNRVAALIEGKVLVGHAVHNDLKALLLSHPHYLTRDTQVLAAKHNVVKSKRPSLRHLVEHEFGIAIQEGEHSSVIDARATMAIFRLHRKVWESSNTAAFMRKNLLNLFPVSPAEAKTLAVEAKANDVTSQGVEDGTYVRKRQAEIHSPASAKEILQTKVRARAPSFPRGGRKGISSGLATVTKRRDPKSAWWKELK